MVIFAWIKGVKDEQKPHFTGSIESDPIDSDWSLQDIERLKDEVYKLQKKEP